MSKIQRNFVVLSVISQGQRSGVSLFSDLKTVFKIHFQTSWIIFLPTFLSTRKIDFCYYCYVLWCLWRPLFTIISVYVRQKKKMIRILSISFVLFWQNFHYQGGKKRRTKKRHRDIKEHSNNKVIINFGEPKLTITTYYIIIKILLR